MGLNQQYQSDTSGNAMTSLGTRIAGEDLTNDVTKVETRYTALQVTSNTLVKTGAGFLKSLTFSPDDAAPTAGTITVYDNTAASGTELFSWTLTTAAFIPFTVEINGTFSTGCYVSFTTTADVNVVVTYR